MLTPDGGRSSLIGAQVGWDGDFEGTLNKLKSSGIDEAAADGMQKHCRMPKPRRTPC